MGKGDKRGMAQRSDGECLFNVNWTVWQQLHASTISTSILRFLCLEHFEIIFYFAEKLYTVNYIWPFVHLNEKFERMKIYKM